MVEGIIYGNGGNEGRSVDSGVGNGGEKWQIADVAAIEDSRGPKLRQWLQ